MVPVSILFVALVALVALAICDAFFDPRHMPRLATVRNDTTGAIPNDRILLDFMHKASATSAPSGPQSRREARGWGRDPLKAHRAVVGRDARTPWYIRVRALLALIVIVIGIGMAIAGFTLLILASGRFLLEALAG